MQTKNYLLEEIKQNEMISKNQKQTCATFDYLEKLLILTKIYHAHVNVNSNQKWSNNKCICECNNPKENHVCEKDYSCNPSACACENGKCSESIVDDSLKVMKLSKKKNYSNRF